MKLSLIGSVLLFAAFAQAHIPGLGSFSSKPVLADLNLLHQAGIPVLYSDVTTGVGYAVLTPVMEQDLTTLAHKYGRCGGFESLESENPSLMSIQGHLQQLQDHYAKDENYSRMHIREYRVNPNPQVQQAISQLNPKNLEAWVTWMSSFPSRYNKASDPNVHVRALAEKLTAISTQSAVPFTVEMIAHKSTKQQSIRVHLEGATRPNEVIVLGGHFDSIAQFGGKAPGSDDNASGSSNVLETLRVLLTQPRLARSVDLFWYAGEESGLLGSAEIAKTYKQNNQNVVAVMQLDMTLYPGAGRGQIGLMTDFTSPWLRDVLKGLNAAYVGAQMIESKCGYGCSDHASWYRQGFPTVMPFESTYDTMNQQIHSARDQIGPKSDFSHSLIFSKLALAMALELGNSTQSQPYQ